MCAYCFTSIFCMSCFQPKVTGGQSRRQIDLHHQQFLMPRPYVTAKDKIGVAVLNVCYCIYTRKVNSFIINAC